ncbi:hypothetical protein PVAP13_9KG614201 [Panicum virgatum]|uniref:Uncharacterized protein n=1 Tax=Panicum virgatum TaxID=38727 RepID=A0A8T0NXM1_PANVG|nr:hypothetical protein PVAP13_9KG614201 [Panicum virgatum]
MTAQSSSSCTVASLLHVRSSSRNDQVVILKELFHFLMHPSPKLLICWVSTLTNLTPERVAHTLREAWGVLGRQRARRGMSAWSRPEAARTGAWGTSGTCRRESCLGSR